MIDSFEKLPDSARLWVYQSAHPLSAREEQVITQVLTEFCSQWEAHGNPLRAAFKIDQHQFILLAVDESMHGASGCSIDGSVRIVKNLQEMTGLDLLNRTNIVFLNDGKTITIPLKELKESFSSGAVHAQSLVFNTTIQTIAEYRKSWVLEAEKTWLSKYLPKSALTS